MRISSRNGSWNENMAVMKSQRVGGYLKIEVTNDKDIHKSKNKVAATHADLQQQRHYSRQVFHANGIRIWCISRKSIKGQASYSWYMGDALECTQTMNTYKPMTQNNDAVKMRKPKSHK
ncbi:hypothetical protein L6164_013413 [Bauhinia variegata]|uniref:Uncharacterized protein n=1 Tax=Bauhinia variegata TaxID=167791 RepID=A0ACB9NG48_BAUVA|nr:hypothetical protein L6164_013413 [Bauhinia variegata]